MRLLAIELTESVRSFHVSNAWITAPDRQACRLCRLRARRVTSNAEERNWSTMVFSVSFSSSFAFHVDGDFARQVASRDGSGDFGDVFAPGLSSCWP